MDNELESIIKFLNTNPKRPTVSQNRGFRIRNSKTSHNNSHNLIKNKLISESKSTVSSLQPLKEIIIEEDLLSEIQEFYKEEDEQYDGYDGAGRGSAVHNAGYRKRNAASAGRGLWVTFARI